MHFFRFAAAALASFVLSSCAMQAMPPQKAAQYQRVGILSAMGDHFEQRTIGLLVFGNEIKTQALEFGADDVLTEKFIQALGTRYTVVDLTRYRAEFLKQPKYWPGQKGILAPDRPAVPDVVRNMMGGEALDAYVLITPATANVRMLNQSVSGIGILKVRNNYRFHAAYIVSVLDGKDFSIVADMRAFPIGETGTFGDSPINAPNVPVPISVWEVPDGNKDELRKLFEPLMSQSIPQTLKQAKLLE